MPSDAAAEFDFRPRAVLRLGFAGHRPGRLMKGPPKSELGVIEGEIRTAFEQSLDLLEAAMSPFAHGAAYSPSEEWRNDYSSQKPLLRLVCGAAMGADHIALQAARQRRAREAQEAPADWEVVTILPCEHELFIADAKTDFLLQFPSGEGEDRYWQEILEIPDRLVVLPSSWRMKVQGEPRGDPPPFLSGGRPIQRPHPIQAPVEVGGAADKVGGVDAATPDWALDHTPTAEFLLGEIDVLIVVWDQKEAQGPGGAPDLAAKAHEAGLPVIVINPSNPEQALRRLHGVERDSQKFETRHWYRRVISGATESSPVDAHHMANIVKHVLQRPPEVGGADIPGVTYEDFLRDRKEPHAQCSIYDRIIRLFRACGPSPSHHMSLRFTAISAPMSVEERWNAHLSARPSRVGGLSSARDCPQRRILQETLLARYKHADALARGYGARYRRTYTLLYLLAAFAASLAVFGLVQTILGMGIESEAGKPLFLVLKSLMVFTEMGLLLWMYFAHRSSTKYGFHERYLDYGALAASLRQLRSLSLFSEFPRSAQRLQDEGRWWQWYVMATAREIGPPDGELLPAWHRTVIQGLIDHELSEQAERAKEVLDECAGTEAGAHLLGRLLFKLTFGSLFFLLIALFFGNLGWLAAILGAVASILPIFGAALLGIVQTADFEARASRARLTLDRISRQKATLESLLPEQGYDDTRRALLATVRLAARDLEAFLKLHTHRPLVMPS
jgi:hypothetical protein